MKFNYDGQDYETTLDASTIYAKDYYIQLPDGSYLKVGSWLESMPPIPNSFVSCNHPLDDSNICADAFVTQAHKL